MSSGVYGRIDRIVRLVPCPDCEVFCLQRRQDADGKLYGFADEEIICYAISRLGLAAVVGHGVETRPGVHRCPPIAPRDLLSVCVADVGEGGVACGP